MVMWVPSHIGISGNEHADSGAKRALNHTQITEIPCFPNAMTKPFRNIPQLQNSTTGRPKYNENLSRSQCIMLARLRVGKAVSNSKHYFEKTEPPRCDQCDVELTVHHILTECENSSMGTSME